MKPSPFFLIRTLYLPTPPNSLRKDRTFALISHAMHITINCSLQSVNLQYGILEDDENGIRMLVDIGAVMNTDNQPYHLWIMS